MDVIAVANIKFGKLSIHGVTLDTDDTSYYRGYGDTLVHLTDGKVVAIMSPCDAFREEHIFAENGKLFSRNMAMCVSGNYLDGEYVLECPTPFYTSGSLMNSFFWPVMPDGRELVHPLSRQVSLDEAVERGQMLGKLENEVSRLKSDSVMRKYIDAVQEILSDAPSAYKENENPLYSALDWALAQKKGTM